ncbi:MAG: SseB family protein [Anaerolineaceae bacterium]|nr:SseB family protein [Anaerolineaceae bacterium]
MNNTKLTKEEVISLLTSAHDLHEFEQCDAETLISYLQYGSELYAEGGEYNTSVSFLLNYDYLRQIAAAKILELPKAYLLMSRPSIPLQIDDFGVDGLVLATSKKTAETLIREQQKEGRNCFILEIKEKETSDLLGQYFFVYGFEHAIVWNSQLETSFLLRSDFFDDKEWEKYECFHPNNGLGSKIAVFHQALQNYVSSGSPDSDMMMIRDLEAFGGLMNAEMIVPVKKDKDVKTFTEIEQLLDHIPLVDSENNGAAVKVLPVFTNLCAMTFSMFTNDKYNYTLVAMDDLLDAAAAEYFVIDMDTIGLTIRKDVLADRFENIRSFVSEASAAGIIPEEVRNG